MIELSYLLQIILALSVVYVWVFRFDNIIIEFKLYQLSDLTRNLVGAAKIVLSTLLVVGIWFPPLVLMSSISMAILMVFAQLAHFKVKNPWVKHVPSFVLLVFAVLIASIAAEII
ncbi:MAG: DoxX family protein [Flammeovirgaceae bacterium]|jgi:hypothetical protein|nr:DoxX family protein [Flammeovirgaceae bacterium]|tara:strand:- start:32804 stop:33148 length:345 start_codon:yes stop_codon:yes gene_type:complete